MSTVFAQAVGAIVTALGTVPAVSTNIFRARTKPIAKEAADAVVVRVLGSDIERFAINGGPMNLDTQIAVECYARASGASQSPDAAVDALLAKVYARLAANATLGGLVMDLKPTRLDYDFDADGEATACATLTYTVLHRAANLTLE